MKVWRLNKFRDIEEDVTHEIDIEVGVFSSFLCCTVFLPTELNDGSVTSIRGEEDGSCYRCGIEFTDKENRHNYYLFIEDTLNEEIEWRVIMHTYRGRLLQVLFRKS